MEAENSVHLHITVQTIAAQGISDKVRFFKNRHYFENIQNKFTE